MSNKVLHALKTQLHLLQSKLSCSTRVDWLWSVEFGYPWKRHGLFANQNRSMRMKLLAIYGMCSSTACKHERFQLFYTLLYFKNVKLYQVKKRKHLPQLSSKFTSLYDEDEQTKRNRKRLCRLYASKQSPLLIHQSESHRTHTQKIDRWVAWGRSGAEHRFTTL